MAKLAIKGHNTRGDEVIKTLEMLGGTNRNNSWGVFEHRLYLINTFGDIEDRRLSDSPDYRTYTLEEFLEKYPYKVGDKVRVCVDNLGVIISMRWEIDYVVYKIKLSKNGYETSKTSENLQPYKKETMEKEISGAIVDRFICLEGYDFCDDKGNIIDTKEIIMKKQPKYPKTYEECCKVLLLNPEKATYSVCGLEYKRHLIVNFQRLLVCRDSYWKIAGNWKPDYNNGCDTKYIITVAENKIFTDVSICFNSVLIFPTEEMRDSFLENFKDLIEECKELL